MKHAVGCLANPGVDPSLRETERATDAPHFRRFRIQQLSRTGRTRFCFVLLGTQVRFCDYNGDTPNSGDLSFAPISFNDTSG